MYQRDYTVPDEHIDFQNIVDGLYYPFYMEDCRHKFVEEILGFDMKANADQGLNIVISEYTIKFKKPLAKDDKFIVTCSCHPSAKGKPRIYFKQQIIKDDKVLTEATFKVTCVPSEGRPHIPDSIATVIKDNDPFED